VNQNGAEPKIRVGLLYIEKTENKKYLPLEISTRGQKSYDVYGDKNQLLLKNTKGEKIKISFDFTRKRYIVDDTQNHRLLTTDSPLLMVPPAGSEIIFKLDNWKNNTFWGEPVTDNEYYGQFKVEYNPVTERLWVINQLPIEKYLESVAEAGDDAPMEFLKAQAVAARTYAFYRLKIPKYTAAVNKVPFIDVRDTQADQVYRGVKKSERAPNFLQAVQETRGIIMTYMGDPALAYYFAQSDGKTRSANLVGMTKKLIPYLVAKDDPPGQGKKLLGHGVGMPQRSAITAAGQGATYSQILKYYYTNIDLTRMY
jgi:peptidoglycan hydrolase-like amidase